MKNGKTYSIREYYQMAQTMDANGFLDLLHTNRCNYTVLDLDNLCNPNEGYVNLVIAGMEDGESILFVDGKYEE